MAKRSNGEGQLRQRKNKSWELSVMVGYHEDGRRKMKSFYGKTQKEAKDKYEGYKQKLAIGIDADQNLKFGEWADKWYSGHKDLVTPTTYESYRYTLVLLKNAFENRKLNDIKPMHIENFLQTLKESGKSDSYISKCRGMLYQILHKAEANDLILKNPVRFAQKMKKSGDKRRKEAFTKEEIRLLIGNLPDDKIGHTIIMMLSTGMRGQEMLALQPKHIEPDGSKIYIRQAVKMLKGKPYIGEPKSRNSIRDICVPELFRYAAIRLREQEGEFVWDSTIPGQPFNLRNFREKFRKAITAIPGVRPLTPHSCRHTYVTQMQALGVDMEVIKSMSGHSEVDMTENYLHIQEEAQEKAARLFSEEFGAPDDK